MFPRQSPTTHTEQLGAEVAVDIGRVRRSRAQPDRGARVAAVTGPRARRDGRGLGSGLGPRGRGSR